MRVIMLLLLAVNGLTAACAFHAPSMRYAGHRAICHPRMAESEPTKTVPIEFLNPLPSLEPREVIGTVMAALHRSNWDNPTPHFGFEVALRFFAPTHQAKLLNAKPAGFARFMQRPHKVSQILWNEFRYEGPLVELRSDAGILEAYQAVSLRTSSSDEWMTSRWKLVQVEFDHGAQVMPSTWLVEHIFVAEPDTAEDIEFYAPRRPRRRSTSTGMARSCPSRVRNRWCAT